MSAEILVGITPMEARIVAVEDGAVRDIHIERQGSRGILGTIYSEHDCRRCLSPGSRAGK